MTVIFLLVAGVLHGHDGQDEVSHAMVLDIFDKENDKLIFKNTYDQDGQPKKVKVRRTHPNAPEELYFVHIEVKDIDNLPGQEERRAKMEAKIEERKAKIQALRKAKIEALWEAKEKKSKATMKSKADEDAQM